MHPGDVKGALVKNAQGGGWEIAAIEDGCEFASQDPRIIPVRP
jgi:hypothetical protein